MKLLVVNWKDPLDPTAGGAEEYARRIAEIWARDGHEVDLFVPRGRWQAADEVVGGVHYIRRGPRPTIFARARQHVRRQGSAYDLILELVSTRPFFLHELAGRRAVALYLQMADDVWDLEFPPPVSWIGRYVLEPRWLRRLRGARLLSISPSTSASLERHGLSAEAVIPPGCDPPGDQEPRVPSTSPRLGFLGRMVRTKRPGDALKAFEMVRERYPHASLDVIGAGYMKRELEAIPHPGVTFHGFVSAEEKDRILRQVDVLLVPGTREGWGIVAIEAAIRGIPVVAYDIAGLRDAVVDGQTGLVVHPDPVSMGQAAVELWSDGGRWHAMADRARVRGSGFTWETAAAGVLEAATAAGPTSAGRLPISPAARGG